MRAIAISVNDTHGRCGCNQVTVIRAALDAANRELFASCAMRVDTRLRVLELLLGLFAAMKSAAPRFWRNDPASIFFEVFLHYEKAQALRASSQPWLI